MADGKVIGIAPAFMNVVFDEPKKEVEKPTEKKAAESKPAAKKSAKKG